MSDELISPQPFPRFIRQAREPCDETIRPIDWRRLVLLDVSPKGVIQLIAEGDQMAALVRPSAAA